MDLEAFLQYKKENEAFWETIYEGEQQNVVIEHHKFGLKLLELNAEENDFQKDIIDHMKKDEILVETFRLFEDFFTFEKK